MVVRSSTGGWSLMVDQQTVPVWTVSTKKKAVTAAKRAAADLACELIVERQSGDVQRVYAAPSPA